MQYTNPVFAGYMADPFVWRHEGAYYAVGTGAPEAKAGVTDVLDRAAQAGVETRLFPLLCSDDLVTWRDIGGALVPPNEAYGDLPYAPEVAYADGKFFLYYSVGRMNQVRQLRVAVADRPEGPYVDEARLTDPFTCYFANDPHPFRDDDGTWYLFYSRDFVDDADGFRVGGGLVVDRLVAMTSLAGDERIVARPRFDWQRFDARRVRYGDEWDWHLLEGPAVVKRDNRYYCFYSGGNWESCDYGVDYVVAENITGPWSDAGAENGPRVLRAVPKLAPGPGHNSVVIGPDGVTPYLVYHCWDPGMRDRRMCIDELVWTDDGPRCEGPSTDARQIMVTTASLSP